MLSTPFIATVVVIRQSFGYKRYVGGTEYTFRGNNELVSSGTKTDVCEQNGRSEKKEFTSSGTQLGYFIYPVKVESVVQVVEMLLAILFIVRVLIYGRVLENRRVLFINYALKWEPYWLRCLNRLAGYMREFL